MVELRKGSRKYRGEESGHATLILRQWRRSGGCLARDLSDDPFAVSFELRLLPLLFLATITAHGLAGCFPDTATSFIEAATRPQKGS